MTTAELNRQIDVVNDDLLTFIGDGLIVPTISDGLMVEGIALRVKEAGGEEVEEMALRCAPIAVGASVVSPGGKLKVKFVIHSPLIEQPGMRIGVENIRRATRAGLLAASHFKMETIGIPGMGFGENGVPHDEAARAIIDEVRAYKELLPAAVYLMDTDPDMHEAFIIELGEP